MRGTPHLTVWQEGEGYLASERMTVCPSDYWEQRPPSHGLVEPARSPCSPCLAVNVALVVAGAVAFPALLLQGASPHEAVAWTAAEVSVIKMALHGPRWLTVLRSKFGRFMRS